MIAAVVASESPVELLVFHVAGRTFAADASLVRRIARAGHASRLSDALGMPGKGDRALVVLDESGQELEICIDEVVGIQSVPVAQLRRVPSAAGSPRGVLGFWLDGARPVVLVDLTQCLDLPGGE
ncbi:MAG: chemotaxis protein CheW [Myxococcaceae bacterium]